MKPHFFGLGVTLVVGSLVAACVGDSSTTTTPDGPDATAKDSASGGDTSTVDASMSDTSVGDSSVADAFMGDSADSAPPNTTCIDQTIAMGAFNHPCQAMPSKVTPGGLFALGTYANSEAQALPYCPIAYVIGSATVYQENGATFFRYWMLRKGTIQDPGTAVRGTYWIKADGSGPIEVVEVCDPQNKGKSKQGTLTVAGSVFTMTWVDGQEAWTKQ